MKMKRLRNLLILILIVITFGTTRVNAESFVVGDLLCISLAGYRGNADMKKFLADGFLRTRSPQRPAPRGCCPRNRAAPCGAGTAPTPSGCPDRQTPSPPRSPSNGHR